MQMFDVFCTECGAKNRCPAHYKNRSVKCSECSKSFVAAHESETTFKFHCPSCGGSIQAEASRKGSHAACPHCNKSIIVTPDSEKTPSTIAPPSRYVKSVSLPSKTRSCPYCAEEIRADAVICRFCQIDLRSGRLVSQQAAAPPSEQVVQARSSVTDGVKLGCGMFIVLPLLIILALFLLMIFGAIF